MDKQTPSIRHLTVQDENESFTVSVSGPEAASKVALFAVGAGGLPERYITLLKTLGESGFQVIAPHFERLASPFPSESELLLRARRLSLALDAFADSQATVFGAGHSIGAATLLAMSGASLWLGPGQPLAIARDRRLSGLALLAPPTGFFQAPGAFDAFATTFLTLWVGSQDNITPPAQTQFLKQALTEVLPVEVKLVDGGGHFSFMDNGPPHITEPLQDKSAFLQAYSTEVSQLFNQLNQR